MKRILITVASSVVFLTVTAVPALAEYAPGGVNTPPQVAPNVLQAPQGLAFTGGESVVPLVLAAIALLAIGVALVAFARRVRGAVTE